MAVELRSPILRAAIVLALCSTMPFDGTCQAATPSRCLTPAAERALKDLLAAGTFQETLGRDLTLQGLSLSATQIEVRVADAGGLESGISLSLQESSGRQPDGRGKRFVFHLAPPKEAQRADRVRALLAAADLIDRTIPDAAFADCSGQPSAPPEVGQSPLRGYYPRSLALFSAAVQMLILLGATVFGWRTIRSIRSA